MEKIFGKLQKGLVWTLYIISVMSVLSYCNTCNIKKELTRTKKEVIKQQQEIDSLNSSIYSKEELDIRMEIEGLRTSKRTLYDWNTIVRTVVRPDDKMNEYDEKLSKLQKELDKLKKLNEDK